MMYDIIIWAGLDQWIHYRISVQVDIFNIFIDYIIPILPKFRVAL